MSKIYPVWWDTTITLYNKYEDPQTQVIRWYRTVIEKCFWQNVGDKLIVGTTALDTTKLICRIPEDDRFLLRHIWVQQPNDEMANYFTLSQGDIIVKGEVEDEINEYQKGSRASDLISKYKDLGCIEVREVTINTGTGRNNPHYHVRGV